MGRRVPRKIDPREARSAEDTLLHRAGETNEKLAMSSAKATDDNPAPVASARRRPGRPAKPIDLDWIRGLKAQKQSIRQIARATGVSKSNIRAVLRRLTLAEKAAREITEPWWMSVSVIRIDANAIVWPPTGASEVTWNQR
jgi:hypothetical protein